MTNEGNLKDLGFSHRLHFTCCTILVITLVIRVFDRHSVATCLKTRKIGCAISGNHVIFFRRTTN